MLPTCLKAHGRDLTCCFPSSEVKDSTYLRVNKDKGRQVGAFSSRRTKGLTNIPTADYRLARQKYNNLLNDRFMDTGATENAVPEAVGNPSGFCYTGM